MLIRSMLKYFCCVLGCHGFTRGHLGPGDTQTTGKKTSGALFECDKRIKEITQRQAEEMYNIPIRRVINKLKTSKKIMENQGTNKSFPKRKNLLKNV